MVAIALQATALRRNRVARFGSPDADHAHLRVVLEGALILRRGAVGKLPDAHAIVPATPVVDHGAVPGRTGRDDGDHHSAWLKQCSGIGDDAVLGAFAVLEKVRWVRQHQAYASFGDAHALKRAADEFGMG